MGNVASGFLKIIGGIIIILVAVLVGYFNLWGWNWTQAVIDLLQGALLIVIALIGIFLIFLGFTGFKD